MIPPRLDPVSTFGVLLAGLVSPELAPYVNAYGIIAFGALVGAGVALLRRRTYARVHWLVFVFLVASASIGCTVSASELIRWGAGYAGLPKPDIEHLLFPVAAAIAVIGEDWPDILRAGWRRLTVGRSGPPAPTPR